MFSLNSKYIKYNKQYCNRVSRQLPELSEGENLRVKSKWKILVLRSIVCKVALRSYLIDVCGQISGRNRSFNKWRQEYQTHLYICGDHPFIGDRAQGYSQW